MDVKGLAWIGNIYEKFEAMCLEVEEAMYQDTAKYVENQVQTVGASVKRFYSEVMQDLHPDSYIDPVKVAAADLPLNPYAHPETKRITSAKKDPGETHKNLTDDCKVISGKTKTGVYKRAIARRKGYSSVNHPLPVCGPIGPLSGNLNSSSSLSLRKKSHEVAACSIDVVLPSAGVEGESREAKEKLCNPTLDPAGVSHASVDSLPVETILPVVPVEQKQPDSRVTSSTSCLSSEPSAPGTCANSEAISQTLQTINDDARYIKSVEVLISHQERLDDSSVDAAKIYDIIDAEGEIIEQFNDSTLEESCVLVEGEKLHLISKGNASHKSYKKKLREAFLTKKRSTRKEYEQLATKYKEQDSNQECLDRLMPAPSADKNAKMLSSHSCSESDWELL